MEIEYLIINGDNKVELFTKGGEYIAYDPKKHTEIKVNMREIITVTEFK